jgi:hypothetical protein
MKFVQFAIVQVIGSVEDERTFSTLPSMKSKLWNWLIEHLNIAICKFVQGFFLLKRFLLSKLLLQLGMIAPRLKLE